MIDVRQTVVETPIGGIGVATDDHAVVEVSFGARTGLADGPVESAVLAAAVQELREYFAGVRTAFTVPVTIVAGSAFERAVWARIAAIPYGETLSYGAIARAVGEPGGAQAVGLACNRNPVPVIVPCHRVIGADGKLVGFGGGLSRKQWLLQLEAKVSIERAFAAGLD